MRSCRRRFMGGVVGAGAVGLTAAYAETKPPVLHLRFAGGAQPRRISGNVVLGDRTVSFYAVDPAEAAPLAEHLRSFAPELPPGVSQLGPYTR